MAAFYVNGTEVTVGKKQKLMRFLRDELHLTSVKDGCSQGACGTCTVIIDGKASRACVPDTDKMEGKHIVTVEGLSEWEKKLYTYAYGEAGAVQCGFCIPGMVMCTKALLDGNADPSEEQIREALRNNYCRCTGYVKIIAAVKLAAKYKKLGTIPEASDTNWELGHSVQRLDVAEKVQGYGKYPDDWELPGMLYGSAVRSAYARARVRSIDVGEARKLPGVAAVLTAEDVPGENKIGHIKHDQYTLIPVGGLVHYLGDAVALVAAEDRETLEAAKKLVKVEYEVLPAVHDPTEAAAKDAPRVFDEEESNVQAYKHVKRGDADRAIAHSKHVISEHLETPWTEHAFLEPECAVAFIDEDEDVKILSTDQSSHTTLHECCLLLGTKKVKVENQLVGGAFGGKEDMSVQHHAALLSYCTRRPVKVKLSRAESLLVHPKRHPFWMDFTVGCDENGVVQGVKAKVVSDTGAFASLGGPVLERACTHAAGPYHYENFEIEGTAYYTNNPPAGAFRGFGVTQTCFAMETILNQMADKVGISPWEIRYRNAIRPGETLPNGQIVGAETGLVETLDAVKEEYDKAVADGHPVGLACAMKNAGVGVGLPDWGRCRLIVEKDAKVHIYAGASCLGQGLGTVLVQMVVTNTPLSREDVVYERSNTWIAPDSGDSSGSRQTLVTGEACRRACEELCAAIREVCGDKGAVDGHSRDAGAMKMAEASEAAKMAENSRESVRAANMKDVLSDSLRNGGAKTPETVEKVQNADTVKISCESMGDAEGFLKYLTGREFYGEYLAKTDPLGADVPNPVSHVAYGYATQVCILDEATGKVAKIIAAHDVGKAVNPKSCEGQIEGGVVMSMGYALRERFPIDEDCRPVDKFGKLGLFRAHETPEIEAVVVDKPGLDLACGAIGIGEITSIPTAPAIADAYFRLDGKRRLKLPICDTPYEKK